MKAIVSNYAGGPDSLTVEERPTPEPQAGEVLLSVRACGVNYPDVLIIRDLYQIKPERPFIPGTEVSGVVEKVGSGVLNLNVGDRVIGFSTHGGMAQQIALSADSCVLIPNEMPFDEAAVFTTTYGTSYHALKNRANLKGGETLLVLGAAGGTGIAAVEIGKALGAKVIGAVSTEKKASFVMSCGADECFVYPVSLLSPDGKRDMANQCKEACGPRGANVIYDPVGGDYSEAALRAISYGGRHLIVGFPAGVPRIPMNLPLLKCCQIVGVYYDAFTKHEPGLNRSNTKELFDLYRSGAISPKISASYDINSASEAFRSIEAREAIGKIAIVFN
jgi:NADPH2:quinone reductase